MEKVALNFNKPDQVDLDQMTVAEAKKYHAAGQFAPGSMGPKVKAAIQFLENGGKEVIITNPASIYKAIKGETGTRIVP